MLPSLPTQSTATIESLKIRNKQTNKTKVPLGDNKHFLQGLKLPGCTSSELYPWSIVGRQVD